MSREGGKDRRTPRAPVLFVFAIAALAAALSAVAAPPEPAPSTPASARPAPVVRAWRLEGMIHGVTAEIIENALDTAARENDAAFLLELDTPGGLVDATEDIVRALLASRVPVVAWVGPRGAHAASAGFFLLETADVAAMAPVTRTGASSVINATGENKEGDIALKKASQDLQALMRSLAKLHGRPADVAEKAVIEAKSWNADEALEAKLIDLVAPTREELLAKIDGREVARPDGTKLVLHTAGAHVVDHRLTWTEDVKNTLLTPTILALLFALAVLGIYVEFQHPGVILPGAVGAVALVLFLYGTHALPVRYLAGLLVLVGIVAFILEVKIASFGLLGFGGAVAIGLGLWLMFPSDVPGMRLPLASLVMVLAFLVAGLATVTFVVQKTLRLPPTTGREGMLGEIGVAGSALAPDGPPGIVHVHGEVWHAHARAAIPAGASVRIVGSEGLLLEVEPAGSRATMDMETIPPPDVGPRRGEQVPSEETRRDSPSLVRNGRPYDEHRS